MAAGGDGSDEGKGRKRKKGASKKGGDGGKGGEPKKKRKASGKKPSRRKKKPRREGAPEMRRRSRRRGEADASARLRGLQRIAMIRAIAHPLRRRTLRLLHDCNEARSPKQIAAELHVGVSAASYQVSVLRGLGALESAGTTPVRGAIEHFYNSTVRNDPPIEMLLEETRQVDEENARRGYRAAS